MRKVFSTTRDQQVQVANELHTLNTRDEGRVLTEYLEFQLARLADQALSCTPEQLEKVQGRADMCKDALRDLTQGPNIIQTDE